MPYIDDESRRLVDERGPATVGELTYRLTTECLAWLDVFGTQTTDFRRIASVLGALEATKLELYRRRIAPYEDRKAEENGDVY